MPCSLKAQLQRLFIPNSVKDKIYHDDLMVTTDVDTFVMKSDIFDELLSMTNWGKIAILRVTTKLVELMRYEVIGVSSGLN